MRFAYIDGELCALRPDGTSSFAELQAAMDDKTTDRLVYFAFDLLFLDGKDLIREPLRARKRRSRDCFDARPWSFANHREGRRRGKELPLRCAVVIRDARSRR